MKRLSLLILTILIMSSVALSQSTDTLKKKNLYDPTADAKMDIAAAVKKAESEGKHVMLQIGGNWCGWCILFDKKVNSNDTLRTAIEKDFIVYHLNYSRENKNVDVLSSLEFPQRFGFPVFVILDGKGNRLHTQNSGYLEQGKGHNTDKVLAFFRHWSPTALDAKQYKD
jgi:thioredoxin-related protein